MIVKLRRVRIVTKRYKSCVLLMPKRFASFRRATANAANPVLERQDDHRARLLKALS